MSDKGRFTFSHEQLDQYFDRIALPQPKRIFNVSSLGADEQLLYLTALLKHQLARIPFENLTQHYSGHRVVDVKPLHIFRKVIDHPGWGGYCMEANSLLHHLLLSLGFDCYIAAGRVWTPAEKWTGWTHLVNLVTIGDTKYLCDSGFGTNEPIVPIPLQHNAQRVQVWPAESKLVHESLPQYLSDCKLWICQFRARPQAEWSQAYCFSETELLPQDVIDMNYSPWLNRAIHFTQQITCVRYTIDGEEEDGPNGLPTGDLIDSGVIHGTLTISHDKLKWRRVGRDVLDANFESEEDRINALKQYWGI